MLEQLMTTQPVACFGDLQKNWAKVTETLKFYPPADSCVLL